MLLDTGGDCELPCRKAIERKSMENLLQVLKEATLFILTTQLFRHLLPGKKYLPCFAYSAKSTRDPFPPAHSAACIARSVPSNSSLHLLYSGRAGAKTSAHGGITTFLPDGGCGFPILWRNPSRIRQIDFSIFFFEVKRHVAPTPLQCKFPPYIILACALRRCL